MIVSNSKKWLVAIAVILIGIFAIMLYDVSSKNEGNEIGDSISDVADSVDDGATELKEEIIDEIDDNTDSQ
jgi:hypothetical protein